MKIVIVGQYYWPDNFTINDIAEDLVKKGHIVKVLTGLPDYATNKVPKNYKRGKNRRENRNGVEIFRVPIIARHSGFFFRVLNYTSFFLSSSFFARRHKELFDCDVIFAYQTAPVLMGNAAIVLKKILNKPLFYYCMDIWPDQVKVWNIKENSFLFKIIHKYCRYAYGYSDLLAVSSKPFKKYMIEVNEIESNKIVYLPNHYDEIIDVDDLSSGVIQEEINLIYAGNIGKQQNLECLLKAVKKTKTKTKYLLHIYGEGTSYLDCKELASSLEINDKVIFYGRVPKSNLNSVYPLMDAFVLTLCSEKQIGFVANTIPSRLQGYMTAGKPIIASIDGGAKDIINQVECGIAVPADDDNALAKALDEYIDNKEKYKQCGENAKKYFKENFERSVVMDKIEGYLKLLMIKRNS